MRKFLSKDTCCLLLLLVFSVLVYFPVLNNQLVDMWDDGWMVKNHYTEDGFSLSNLFSILVDFYHGQYAPLNEYFYLLIYIISGGYNPFAFHLASLLLHIANAFLVYFLIKKIMMMSGRMELENIGIVSFVTALVFSIHPLSVESVAWMSASKVLVFAFFYLLGGLSFLYFLDKGQFIYYVLTLVFGIFSFLGKEQAVTFPFMLLLFLWFLKYDVFSMKTLWTITPFFIFSVFGGVVTLFSQEGYTASQFNDYSLWERCIYACYSLVEYVCKYLFPVKLSYLYPFITLPGEPLPGWLLLYPLFLLIVLVTLWKPLMKWPISFGVLFFIVNIVIVLHLIPLSRFAVIADRYMYIPSIGFGFILSYYLQRLYMTLKRRSQYCLFFLFSLYLIYLGGYSNVRTRVWSDSETLKFELRELLRQRDENKSTGIVASSDFKTEYISN